MRAGPFEDFKRDGSMVPTMAPPWLAPPGVPFKLVTDIYAGNTDVEEYQVNFEQLDMFNMWNEPGCLVWQ